MILVRVSLMINLSLGDLARWWVIVSAVEFGAVPGRDAPVRCLPRGIVAVRLARRAGVRRVDRGGDRDRGEQGEPDGDDHRDDGGGPASDVRDHDSDSLCLILLGGWAMIRRRPGRPRPTTDQ